MEYAFGRGECLRDPDLFAENIWVSRELAPPVKFGISAGWRSRSGRRSWGEASIKMSNRFAVTPTYITLFLFAAFAPLRG